MRDKTVSLNDCYQRTQMKKEHIIKKLRENGCRITKQRKVLLDIILMENCSCCKEIYYKALKADGNIGSATVYRMINMLEEIGAINRKNMYKVSCENACSAFPACTIELDNEKQIQLSDEEWRKVIQEGLKACGYIENQKIKTILMHSCSK